MMVNDNDFEIFEQRFSMYVIMMVGTYPGCIKADISPLGDPRRTTKFARVEYLIEKGFIEHPVINSRVSNKLQLTCKGQKLFEHVTAIHGIINDESE
ncbi:MAG: hypothetical protein RBR71_11560 [Gudongella sp.]|nr:hypothetical protein [Gudongella sp.]